MSIGSPRHALVTGGAGFVGSNLVRIILERLPDTRVTVLDDLSTGTMELVPNHERLRFVRGSVEDSETVKKTMEGVDLVFHLAARNIIASTKNPRSDFETNIGGTLNVLLAARDLEVDKVVYTSSASVYGNPRYLPINEDENLSTLTPYSVSKLAGENYCRSFYDSYGLPTVAVRYSNVYGPAQNPENPYCGVVSKFIQTVRNGVNPRIHGDGEQTRDFTYVRDAVEATLEAGLSVRGLGDVFNIASGVETSVNTLAKLIIEICDADLKVDFIDRRDIDNIRRRVLNIERIRRVFRWVPTHTLERGLRKTVEWLDQRDGGGTAGNS